MRIFASTIAFVLLVGTVSLPSPAEAERIYYLKNGHRYWCNVNSRCGKALIAQEQERAAARPGPFMRMLGAEDPPPGPYEVVAGPGQEAPPIPSVQVASVQAASLGNLATAPQTTTTTQTTAATSTTVDEPVEPMAEHASAPRRSNRSAAPRQRGRNARTTPLGLSSNHQLPPHRPAGLGQTRPQTAAAPIAAQATATPDRPAPTQPPAEYAVLDVEMTGSIGADLPATNPAILLREPSVVKMTPQHFSLLFDGPRPTPWPLAALFSERSAPW